MLLALQDKIIVEKLDETSETLDSGIVVVSYEKDKTTKGKVVIVGEGYISEGKLFPLSVKVGDTVVFNQTTFTAPAFKYKNRYYLTVTEKEVLAVIRDEN